MAIKSVGVIGAGMMGSEISLCFAMAGCDVLLKDISMDLAETGKEKATKALDRAIRKGKFDEGKRQSTLERIKPTDKYDDFSSLDLVIEAAVESFEIKKSIFEEIDGLCRDGCVFASNTSSISITKLASTVSAERVDQFIGMHFFSPASVMKLVEVIPGELTSPESVEFAKKAVSLIDKTPVEVKDVVGFAVNRMLNIFFIEAIRLVEEGVISKEDLDTACKLGLGHPVGPIELLDIIGLDLNLQVHEILFNEYGDRFRPRPMLRRLVNAGLDGRKSGEGFYDWQ